MGSVKPKFKPGDVVCLRPELRIMASSWPGINDTMRKLARDKAKYILSPLSPYGGVGSYNSSNHYEGYTYSFEGWIVREEWLILAKKKIIG